MVSVVREREGHETSTENGGEIALNHGPVSSKMWPSYRLSLSKCTLSNSRWQKKKKKVLYTEQVNAAVSRNGIQTEDSHRRTEK